MMHLVDGAGRETVSYEHRDVDVRLRVGPPYG